MTGRKKGLARGIASFAQEHQGQLPQARSGTRTAGIDLLHPNPFQPRRQFPESELEELARSIADHGVLQPILVRSHPDRTGHWQILAGERRWRAAQHAGRHEVPVIAREADDTEAAVLALIENVQRSDLNPVEQARGYRRLMQEFRLTQHDVAQQVGQSRSQVANTLRLLDLPEKVLTMVAEGRLSAGHARALVMAARPVVLAEIVVKRGLNVRQTEQLVRQSRRKPKPPAVHPETRQLEEDLQEILGLRVDIRDRGNTGEIRIRYGSLDQFDDLVRRLTGPR